MKITFFAFTTLLLVLAGCGDPAAQAQRNEEAVVRGDPPSAASLGHAQNAFETACTGAGGIWQKATTRCAMTATMCPDPGKWKPGYGCVFSSVSPAECGEMANQGLIIVDGVCAITDMSSEQFKQLGLVGEH